MTSNIEVGATVPQTTRPSADAPPNMRAAAGGSGSSIPRVSVSITAEQLPTVMRPKLATLERRFEEIISNYLVQQREKQVSSDVTGSRSQGIPPQQAPESPAVVLSHTNKQVTFNGATVISLTSREFLLVEFLYENQHRTISRSQLRESVWSDIVISENSRTIDMHITRLRRKLGGAVRIRSVRGVGYSCTFA